MSISRKRKKELRKLQSNAQKLWESQQTLVEEAGDIAREAGRQLGNYNREQLQPAVQEGYQKYAVPAITRGVRATRDFYNKGLVPAAGAVVGSALSVMDAANDTRERIAAGRGLAPVNLGDFTKRASTYGSAAAKRLTIVTPEPKKGIGAGGVIAIILGVAAAVGVAYAAWQTLRADDELWVADDPLSAPDA
ncbi:hypothetical protein [Microbacterium sp. No. 7]|uniref:hypothetical protein n=1 Tax=Microbacterium sp. No. 7 TaxID=1714373 RepID=UPI0006D15FEC|nr:hypothetical protein [Microbacterium sp. No. 7]ALJ18469.1 DNA helicase [Microbacterium sp. No. 7]